MKHIIKGKEPQDFSAWKALANDDWQPTYDGLQGDANTAVINALMEEQGYICCYCERRLEKDYSHIEHFKPRSDPAVDPLDYSNMLRSCQDRLKKRDLRHCGNLKGNWFDNKLLVSPLDPSCEGRFSYTADGIIRPADESDDAAKTTIEKLGLDILKLNDLRKKAIEPFLDETLEDQEFSQFVKGYLRKDSDGMFGQFWTTINYIFGSLVT
jgi:uncharacterized protein (TIGR02646 family)